MYLVITMLVFGICFGVTCHLMIAYDEWKEKRRPRFVPKESDLSIAFENWKKNRPNSDNSAKEKIKSIMKEKLG